jgi:hypothetical protein
MVWDMYVISIQPLAHTHVTPAGCPQYSPYGQKTPNTPTCQVRGGGQKAGRAGGGAQAVDVGSRLLIHIIGGTRHTRDRAIQENRNWISAQKAGAAVLRGTGTKPGWA